MSVGGHLKGDCDPPFQLHHSLGWQEMVAVIWARRWCPCNRSEVVLEDHIPESPIYLWARERGRRGGREGGKEGGTEGEVGEENWTQEALRLG